VQAATAEHKLPAPMPEFMSQEQVTKWQADRIAKAQAKKSAETAATQASSAPSAFYTGKPYVEETGSYAFRFRQYDPELNRWTSADPSGYPDSPNNSAYNAIPTFEYDWQGLVTQGFTITTGFASNIKIDVNYTFNSSPVITGTYFDGYQGVLGLGINYTGSTALNGASSSDRIDENGATWRKYSFNVDWSLYQSLLAGIGDFSGVIWGPDLLGTGTANFTTNEIE